MLRDTYHPTTTTTTPPPSLRFYRRISLQNDYTNLALNIFTRRKRFGDLFIRFIPLVVGHALCSAKPTDWTKCCLDAPPSLTSKWFTQCAPSHAQYGSCRSIHSLWTIHHIIYRYASLEISSSIDYKHLLYRLNRANALKKKKI